MNIENSKIIKIYGATLARKDYRTRAYGHGANKFIVDGKGVMIEYIDYFIDDLVALIKKQKLEKEIIEKLKEPTLFDTPEPMINQKDLNKYN